MKKIFWIFFKINIFSSKKSLQVSNLDQYATENLKVPKTFKLGFSQKRQMGFSKKRKFLKITKGRKFGVECNWISKISQNIRKLAFAWKKKEIDSSKKNLEFLKTAKGNLFIVECNSPSKISHNVRKLDFRKQDWFF